MFYVKDNLVIFIIDSVNEVLKKSKWDILSYRLMMNPNAMFKYISYELEGDNI